LGFAKKSRITLIFGVEGALSQRSKEIAIAAQSADTAIDVAKIFFTV
jgi:hypothetical protein